MDSRQNLLLYKPQNDGKDREEKKRGPTVKTKTNNNKGRRYESITNQTDHYSQCIQMLSSLLPTLYATQQLPYSTPTINLSLPFPSSASPSSSTLLVVPKSRLLKKVSQHT
jgi:hypothetical protein